MSNLELVMDYEYQYKIFYDKKSDKYYVTDYDNHFKKRLVKLIHKIEYTMSNEPTDEEIEELCYKYDTYDYCGEFLNPIETSGEYLFVYAWFELANE